MNPNHFPSTETLDAPDRVLPDKAVDGIRAAVDTLASAQLPGQTHSKWPGTDPTRYGDWEKSGRCIDF